MMCKKQENFMDKDNFDFFEDEEEPIEEVKTPVGAASVVVAGVFLLCLIFVFAKVLFTSNTDTVPPDIDTATINTKDDEPEELPMTFDESSEDMTVGDLQESSDVSEEESSQEEQGLGVMYITEYAYLHTGPSDDAENIICMSPGIQVTVLAEDPSGYMKITFMNVDGPLTGYVYRDYLSVEQTVIPEWELW